MAERGTFYWKRHGFDAKNEGPNDVGPAWVIETDGSRREINDGGWITRAEAERLAAVGDYTLDAEA